MTKDELIEELENLAIRFSKGWHEGIKIDASDIMLFNQIAEVLAQPEQDNTYVYASRLATAIWQKHYMKDAPKWKPLNTIEGVLTQIDNMTCGLIKEKPAQPEQEPVAYLCENAVGHKYFRWKKPSSTYKPIALYTAPPQRPWVGLTDEDKKQMAKEANYHWEMTAGEYAERIGQLTEAKLKEKNT